MRDNIMNCQFGLSYIMPFQIYASNKLRFILFRSVLILNGNGADIAKHCVPAVPAKRCANYQIFTFFVFPLSTLNLSIYFITLVVAGFPLLSGKWTNADYRTSFHQILNWWELSLWFILPWTNPGSNKTKLWRKVTAIHLWLRMMIFLRWVATAAGSAEENQSNNNGCVRACMSSISLVCYFCHSLDETIRILLLIYLRNAMAHICTL